MHAWWDVFLFVLIPNFWTALYIMPNVYVVVVFVTLIIYLFEFLHHEICEILKSGKLSFILYFTLNCFTFNLFVLIVYLCEHLDNLTLCLHAKHRFCKKQTNKNNLLTSQSCFVRGAKALCALQIKCLPDRAQEKICSIFSFPCLLFHVPWVLVTGEEINSYQRVLIGSI